MSFLEVLFFFVLLFTAFSLVFDYVNGLYHRFKIWFRLKISLNHGGSYLDFPVRLKNKKATFNPCSPSLNSLAPLKTKYVRVNQMPLMN